MTTSRLYETLKNFKYAAGDQELLEKQFEEIAKAAFYSGHFVINKGIADEEFKIEILCIEFYYHELQSYNGQIIKDKKKTIKEFKEDIFPVGSILPHNYGVDINFDDNEKHQFRASFFIRGYQIKEGENLIYVNNEKSDKWTPQDLWYDLFGNANFLSGNKLSIEWQDNGQSYDDGEIEEPEQRIFPTPEKEANRLWRYTKKVKQ